ncbi:NERD domain-containing protein [Sporolactobacillus spathodeae]|uniref:NERD domain-containing protein n=1 Tax=Sporolactobacillus spathodeae TaxID=1465502 RepID=A0ABS2QAR3_9BACL|nr:NERD domain-containing protein [Sporolactobacillus spathodeae]MBM7658894.1 hypothetical protein [Sporolactobacillus spathodeae]
MAQLVKIEQCVSRYQIDFLRYANRYVWLKKRREEEWLLRAKRIEANRKGQTVFADPNVVEKPDPAFYNWLFNMQLEWASRTVDERSVLPKEVTERSWLRETLKEVNDLAFFFYRPIILARNAEIQLDSLILTNDTLWCVKVLNGEPGSVFQEQSPRKWREIVSGGARDQLNPLISLQRSRHVLTSFLSAQCLEMQVCMAVYAPESFIEFVPEQFDLRLVDRRGRAYWYRELSQQSLLLKRQQVETAEALLQSFKTDAAERTDDLI